MQKRLEYLIGQAASVDGEYQMGTAPIRAGVQEAGEPVGVQPEEHMAVEQPDPLLDGHVAEQPGKLGRCQWLPVADHGVAVDSVLQRDGVWSVLGEQLGALRLLNLEQLDQTGGTEQPMGRMLDQLPSSAMWYSRG